MVRGQTGRSRVAWNSRAGTRGPPDNIGPDSDSSRWTSIRGADSCVAYCSTTTAATELFSPDRQLGVHRRASWRERETDSLASGRLTKSKRCPVMQYLFVSGPGLGLRITSQGKAGKIAAVTSKMLKSLRREGTLVMR